MVEHCIPYFAIASAMFTVFRALTLRTPVDLIMSRFPMHGPRARVRGAPSIQAHLSFIQHRMSVNKPLADLALEFSSTYSSQSHSI